MSDPVDLVYEFGHTPKGQALVSAYHRRHGTQSTLILTQLSEEDARPVADYLREEIAGKRVVEVGAGVGWLAVELARYAKSVVAIESDPAWSQLFTAALYDKKPTNLTWIFGTAESVADMIRGDVALICTRSGHAAMRAVAERMCPRVVFVLEETK